jgi:RNA polymerase sigma factor (sigma-70 family)
MDSLLYVIEEVSIPHEPPSYSSERQRFDAEIRSVLYSKSTDRYSLFAFINRSLAQFRLQGMFEVIEVFSQAYLRGISFIESGNRIDRPIAWLRATAYNIIRELNREWADRQKFSSYSDDLQVSTLEGQENHLAEDEIDYQLKLIWEAFEQLSDQDREVLRLRMFENLSWQEVGEHLARSEGHLKSQDALRIQGWRAIKRLREKYHEIAVNKDENQDLAFPTLLGSSS